MNQEINISPGRVLWAIGLGTGLSLIGDTSLYAVLPTHFADAGVTLVSIGVLLSANRFIRLFLNSPMGWLYDRYPRRNLFVPSLFIGALSTALYAVSTSFWPLLLGRLLWGLAWAGIWVGGNTIVLDISQLHNRGRWVGIYQISFFLGAFGGAVLGGLLTDTVGYHRAMGIGAALTMCGAIVALILLPETHSLRGRPEAVETTASLQAVQKTQWGRLASAMGLLAVNRLLLAGILQPTFGLFLLDHVGESVEIASLTVGVATLTGLALGANALISMVSAPVTGSLSDRTTNRWWVAAGGLTPGIAGFGLLAIGAPAAVFLGVPLSAISGGSNQGLSTALVGDLSAEYQRGQRMGVLFTIGDLASAIGPPLAYGVIPWLGLGALYLFSAGSFVVMFFVALWWAAK